jgi:hydroxymethylpyrimidine/phosphomethylpyrimidine kinase
MMNACSELYKFGSQYILLKGGHATEKGDENFENYVIDFLYNGDFQTLKSPRIKKEVHGTGCTFASLIAGYLAKDFNVPKAVEQAKQLITEGIRNSLNVGDGIEVVNVSPKMGFRIGDDEIITSVSQAADELTMILKPNFIPEVGINIGYAKESAQSSEDICALTGRLVRVGEKVDYLGYAEFGTSKHIARIILAAMDKDSKIRSALNIKYRPEIVQVCKELAFLVGEFDRTIEPQDVSSMEWGTKTVIDELGEVPDIIYDSGGLGKEPMIRILGEDPKNVLQKLKKITNSIK